MRAPLFASLLSCVVLVARPAWAQEPGGPRDAEVTPPGPGAFPGARDALDEYLERSLEIRVEQGFFSSVTVYQNGAPIDLGFFGGSAEDFFAGSPDALESAGTFRLLRVLGFSLWLAGLTTLVVEVALLLTDAFGDTDLVLDLDGPTPLFWGLMIGGLVTGGAGATMLQAAPGYLGDAVVFHNRDLLREIRGARAELPRVPTLGYTFRF